MHAVPTVDPHTPTAGESILVSHRNPDDNAHSAREGLRSSTHNTAQPPPPPLQTTPTQSLWKAFKLEVQREVAGIVSPRATPFISRQKSRLPPPGEMEMVAVDLQLVRAQFLIITDLQKIYNKTTAQYILVSEQQSPCFKLWLDYNSLSILVLLVT